MCSMHRREGKKTHAKYWINIHNFKSTVINSFCFLCDAVWCARVYHSIPFHSHLFAGRHTAHSAQRTARTRFKHYDWNVFPVFNADMHLINYLTIMVVLKWHFDGYINIYVCIYYVCYAHLSNKILIWNVRDAIGCKHRNVQKQFFSTVNSSEE